MQKPGFTEAEARAKYEDYRRHISPEGALTLMSGWTGVDFSQMALDQEVRHVTNDAGRSRHRFQLYFPELKILASAVDAEPVVDSLSTVFSAIKHVN